jgi:hypothetical protein
VTKIVLEVVLQRGQPATTCGRPTGFWGEPTTLPRILSCRHMEIYSHGGLAPAGYKVGPASQGVGRPAALLGPPSRLWLTRSTRSKVDRGDLGLTFC